MLSPYKPQRRKKPYYVILKGSLQLLELAIPAKAKIPAG